VNQIAASTTLSRKLELSRSERDHNRDLILALFILALLAIAPLLLEQVGQRFWGDILLRAMILAIAAVSLNLIIGLGGLISLGQSAFFGIGAYSVGILAHYDIDNGWAQLLCAIGASAVFALVTGLVALRTRGVHFIMITLAFGQMLYFVAVGLRQFGGDDGLTINSSSKFAGVNLGSKTTLYYVVLVLLAVSVLGFARVKRSDFGYLLRAAKGNERRVATIGFDIFMYRLTAYIAAGILCGIAGFLNANFASFITPEAISWTSSAELIFMVIVGGVGSISGPIVGPLLFLLLEAVLGGLTVYWQFFFGLCLIGAVLFAKGGLVRLIERGSDS
jgi:branched-chain amino acid transport system permease protein